MVTVLNILLLKTKFVHIMKDLADLLQLLHKGETNDAVDND